MSNAQAVGDEEFLEAAADAAEVVWNHGLLKQVGNCHGISGNAYVSSHFTNLQAMWSSYTEPKLLLAFYLIGLTSSYQREKCMDVITPTHCSKGWEVWLIFFLT